MGFLDGLSQDFSLPEGEGSEGLGVVLGTAEEEMGGQKSLAFLAHSCQQGIHRQIRNIQVSLELTGFQAAAAGQGAPVFCIGGNPAEGQIAALHDPIQSDPLELQVPPSQGQIAGSRFSLEPAVPVLPYGIHGPIQDQTAQPGQEGAGVHMVHIQGQLPVLCLPVIRSLHGCRATAQGHLGAIGLYPVILEGEGQCHLIRFIALESQRWAGEGAAAGQAVFGSVYSQAATECPRNGKIQGQGGQVESIHIRLEFFRPGVLQIRQIQTSGKPHFLPVNSNIQFPGLQPHLVKGQFPVGAQS